MPIVSVRAADRYDPALLDRAVAAHFEALEVARDLRPGMRVLLKPNLLAARDPALAVTTHPEVLAAIARWLRAHGIERITLADSPGGAYTAAALNRLYGACGLKPLEGLLQLNTDVSSGRRGAFSLLTPVLEADYIINCPKLKTHGLTVMTAGVKNLFGCIPGLKKPEWHCLRPTLAGFCDMLLDLAQAVAPQVTLLDAVDCVEGNGPGGGEVRHMGMTLCSRSPYALDEQAARLMGLPGGMAPTVRAARERGLMEGEAVLTGDPLQPADPPFRLPDAILGRERALSANGLFHRFFGRGRALPQVDAGQCVGCGRCAESCPMHLIKVVNHKAVMTSRGCIACFCCQEMCPVQAIGVRRKGLFF